jgi:hypothetical protein
LTTAAVALDDLGSVSPHTLPLPQEILRANLWRAAREGLAGRCLHPVSGELVDVWQLVEDFLGWLLSHVTAASTGRSAPAAGLTAAVSQMLAAVVSPCTGSRLAKMASRLLLQVPFQPDDRRQQKGDTEVGDPRPLLADRFADQRA